MRCLRFFLLAGAIGCGSADAGSDAGPNGTDANAEASASNRDGATLRLGEESYTFRVTGCDLEATDDDDRILRGRGTTPDGRPIRVALERSPGNERGEGEMHNVWVMIGSIEEGESWDAKRRRGPDGAWFVGEVSSERAPGPLFEVDGRSVRLSTTVTADGGADPREIEIQAQCPE